MIKFIRKYPLVIPSLTAIFYLIFILFLFQYDNKYQSLPPYGSDGVIFLQENDFLRNSPIFLIDGWLFSDDIISKKETYIGEYSNLQHGALSTSPHGTALYELDLFYQGNPIEVSLQFPILFQNYSISLDSKTLARGEGSATLTFLLTEGTHSLCINTSSSTGFYSGMYHPPMLGQSNMIYRYTMISCLSYGAAFIFSVLLAIFSISIGYGSKDSINRIFGGFCISFSLYLTYYFIRLFSLPGLSFWYVIQSIAFYSMCYYTVIDRKSVV